tara:strand:- start:5120 stop:5923 length:804 start_codon:yes stop_codon:yes gene_type:complete
MDINKIKNIGKKIKLQIFKKFIEIKEGHPGSILSIFDVVNCLYLGKFIKSSKNKRNNDYFIMSKGHAGSVQYPYLLRNSIIKKREWINWKKNSESCFKIFPNNYIPGIDVTSGSLGHGLGIAAGISIGEKNKKKNIWTIISEGELYEGSIWESLLFIKHNKLFNIKIILDRNDLIILGRTEKCLKLNSIEKKLKGFDFEVKTIDGHNYNEIYMGLNFLKKNDQKNKILIAKTIKGNSVNFMKNKSEWHYWHNLTKMKKNQLLKELKI